MMSSLLEQLSTLNTDSNIEKMCGSLNVQNHERLVEHVKNAFESQQEIPRRSSSESVTSRSDTQEGDNNNRAVKVGDENAKKSANSNENEPASKGISPPASGATIKNKLKYPFGNCITKMHLP